MKRMHRNGYTEKERILIELLEKIMEKPEKIGVSNDKFLNQWIRYDQKNKHFEYEDNVSLGKTPDEVIVRFREIRDNGWDTWSDKAEWFVKYLVRKINFADYQKNNNSLNETVKKIIEERNNEIRNLFFNPNYCAYYQYFIYEDNNVSKFIKKFKDEAIMVTTLDSNNPPHIDIIKYGENKKIDILIKIEVKIDGYDYIEQDRDDKTGNEPLFGVDCSLVLLDIIRETYIAEEYYDKKRTSSYNLIGTFHFDSSR